MIKFSLYNINMTAKGMLGQEKNIDVPFSKADFAGELDGLLRGAEVETKTNDNPDEKSRINQSKLARATGITQQAWSRFLNPFDSNTPDLLTLHRIIKYLIEQFKKLGIPYDFGDLVGRLTGFAPKKTIVSSRNIYENTKNHICYLSEQVQQKTAQKELFDSFVYMVIANTSFIGEYKISEEQLLGAYETSKDDFLSVVNAQTLKCELMQVEDGIYNALKNFDKEHYSYSLINKLISILG